MSSASSPPFIEPEVHFLCDITSCTLLSTPLLNHNLFVAYSIKHGKEWSLVGGDSLGQTHVDYPSGDAAYFNHPIDLHFYTRSMVGWPKIVVEIGKLDFYGGKQLLGYGFAYLPSQPGSHEMELELWKPCGTQMEEVLDFYLGGGPALVDTELIYQVNRAKEERCHLFTTSMGKLFIRAEVVMRNLNVHKIQSE